MNNERKIKWKLLSKRGLKFSVLCLILTFLLGTCSVSAATSIKKCKITLTKSSYTYTGKAIKPEVKVVNSKKKTLKKGTDYTVSYKNNTNAGTASVIIKGKGKYNSYVKKTFKIKKKSLAKAIVTLPASVYTCTGKAITPIPTVKLSIGGKTKTLKKGTDFKLNYANNISAGTATITITGCKNYSGSVKKTFTIKAASSKVTYTTYKDTYCSIDCPNGWKVNVELVKNQAEGFIIKVFDPKTPDLQVIFLLKELWFKTEELYRKQSASSYGAIWSQYPYLSGDVSISGLFQCWNRLSSSIYAPTTLSLPKISSYKSVKNIGITALGGNVEIGQYTGSSGQTVRGIFSTQWINPPLSNVPGSFYSTILMTAPKAKLGANLKTLNHIINSFSFTQAFLDKYSKEQQATLSAASANQAYADYMNDIIMSNWNSIIGN